MIDILSEVKSKILESLAEYRFLTNKQLVILGAAAHTNTVSVQAKRLREIGLLGTKDFSFTALVGKLDGIHYLTPKGAREVADLWKVDLAEIQYLKSNNTIFYRDYQHRINSVSAHIYLKKWLDKTDRQIVLFDTYFDKIGSSRNAEVTGQLKPKTQMSLGNKTTLTPDCIFMYETPSGQNVLGAIEICNGKETARIVAQVKKHLLALSEKAPQTKYKHDRANYMLFVFDHEPTQKAVIKRLLQNPTILNAKDFLLFKHITEMEDFGTNWHTLQGLKVNLK